MIKGKTNAYVYRHIKKGTTEVFYIGIGAQKKYSRAYSKNGRNRWWKAIVNKYGFEVEIIYKNITWEMACELESLLISAYGRKDLEQGNLVNLTDGGDGSVGFVKLPSQIEKWKKSNKGKQDGKKNIIFGKTRGKHHLAREVINLETGIFYDCALDACESIDMKYSTFKGKINRKNYNETYFVYADYYEKGLLPYRYDKKTAKKVINTETGVIYDSILKASRSLNINYNTLLCNITKAKNNKYPNIKYL